MNQQYATPAFHADKLSKLAEHGITASKDFYAKTAAAAQAMTEIADTAWASTKMLNEKIAQNLAINFEATFAAAQAIATAKSLPEVAKLQSDFLQKLTAQAAEQTKEFYDLSTGASQHMLEKMQARFKPSA